MTALAELPSRSSLVEAIKYMLGHWAGLTVFLEDGRIEVDTNTVERTMRPIALGRKNALFAGSRERGPDLGDPGEPDQHGEAERPRPSDLPGGCARADDLGAHAGQPA